jgi:hypothetical protein
MCGARASCFDRLGMRLSPEPSFALTLSLSKAEGGALDTFS